VSRAREAVRLVRVALGAVLSAADTPRGIFLTGVALVGAGASSYSLPVAAIVTGSLFLAVAFLGMWPRTGPGRQEP